MNSIALVEIIFIGIILIVQTAFAIETWKKIQKLRKIIPAWDFFKLKKYHIPYEDLQSFKPIEILQNLSIYECKKISSPIQVYLENGLNANDLFSQTEDESEEAQNEINLLNPNESTNEIFDEILFAINVYLLRNKGAATDFNLIRDVVERNLDMEEENIGHTVTVPLYLGLMGTMVGIVFGLVYLYFISKEGAELVLNPFLGGVAIAMIASFYGLFWTVVNSSFYLKNSRRELEKSKNKFYTFLQTELLPILNQSVSSSIHTLHLNLVKFNEHFTLNLNRLTGMLNKNHDALIAQEKILQALESIDITEFAKANVKVLKELKTGVEQLDKFNQYLNSLNYLVSGTTKLTSSFEDLLTRSNNFQTIAEKLDKRVEESNLLVQFLNDHFKQLDDRGLLIRESVVKVEDVMIKSLQQLEEHTQIKIDSIKQITIKEEDLMTQTFAENRSHISKLSLLEDLKKSIDEFKRNSNDNIIVIKKEVESLKSSIEKTNSVLKEINNSSFIHRTQNVAKSIKQFFAPNK